MQSGVRGIRNHVNITALIGPADLQVCPDMLAYLHNLAPEEVKFGARVDPLLPLNLHPVGFSLDRHGLFA